MALVLQKTVIKAVIQQNGIATIKVMEALMVITGKYVVFVSMIIKKGFLMVSMDIQMVKIMLVQLVIVNQMF